MEKLKYLHNDAEDDMDEEDIDDDNQILLQPNSARELNKSLWEADNKKTEKKVIDDNEDVEIVPMPQDFKFSTFRSDQSNDKAKVSPSKVPKSSEQTFTG